MKTKTIDDAVRDLDGYAGNAGLNNQPGHDYLWCGHGKYYWAAKGSLAVEANETICTRTEFEQAAARWRGDQQWRGPEDGLPPAGTECEAYFMHGATGGWRRAEILRHGTRECAVYVPEINALGWCNTFRPIQSERYKAIEEMADVMRGTEAWLTGDVQKALAEGLLAAGYRKQMSRIEAFAKLRRSIPALSDDRANEIIQALGWEEWEANQ